MSDQKTTKQAQGPYCPICGQSLRAPDAEPKYAPFCSKRCADVDLNRWLGGGYAIPSTEDESIVTEDPSLLPPREH